MYTEFPFFAVIVGNNAAHDFHIGEIVQVIDYYTTFREVNFYHAQNVNHETYLVQETDFETTDKTF